MDNIPPRTIPIYTTNKRRLREMAEAAAMVESYAKTKFTLNNGILMPAIGMGTYRLRQEVDIINVVDYALKAGYRMFDTAAVYHNEVHLNTAFQTLLPKYELEREDIFITTKLSPSDHGGKHVTRSAFIRSIENLGLDHVDMYLVHFPGKSKLRADDPANKQLRLDTWATLEELYEEGKVNAIGVSNFTIRHLSELIDSKPSYIPAVNQVEWHPYYHDPELMKFCNKHDIVLQAYCSLGGTSSSNYSLIQNPVVKKIADKMNKTPAQVLLVWALQHDVAVIPKSTNPQHIQDNISLDFRLSDADLKALDALGESQTKYAWDPSVVA